MPAYPALLRQFEISRPAELFLLGALVGDAARPFSTAVPDMLVLAIGTSTRSSGAAHHLAIALTGGLKPRRVRPKDPQATNAATTGAGPFAS